MSDMCEDSRVNASVDLAVQVSLGAHVNLICIARLQ